MLTQNKTESNGEVGSVGQDRSPAPPAINLPKGGGALRSIDEKFSVNAVNGTCSLSIPLPFSKTRSGLDGSVGLQYNSGSGNGPFGLGWSLSLGSIQRRTDKQLPKYQDALESDVFIFSGAEDLVPSLKDGSSGGAWTLDSVTAGPARADRYRPRIEGLFARIEKISIQGEVGFYWKVTTRENVVTVFGRTPAARVSDPEDSSRTFRWLPEWVYDNKGNCCEYLYKDEDPTTALNLVEEKNRRSGLAPVTSKYLKKVRYGNCNPYYADSDVPFNPAKPVNPAYFFEAVFDYGEHDWAAPSPVEAQLWPVRWDPFSDCRAGFELRTYRLCRRVLFFHYFDELNPQIGLPAKPTEQPTPRLVRSVNLQYKHFQFDNTPYQSQEADFIISAKTVFYESTAPNTYRQCSLPSLDLSYYDVNWDRAVKTVSPEDVIGAPAGVSSGYQWIDLFRDGVPGILTEQAAGWFYKANLGEGRFSRSAQVIPKPSFMGVASGSLTFEDLDADGGKQVVSSLPGLRGYFELTDENKWQPFRRFNQILTDAPSDPNSRLVDLDGDGKPDLLISEENVFRWHPSLGRGGFDTAQFTTKPFDEERGPAIIFADGTQTMFMADMNGDGLSDIVRVRNGEVCFWPNLGYGRFGAKVTMRNAPWFDSPEHFDPTCIQFGDISGTGAADLIYLGRGGFTAWINLAGNAWSDPQPIDPFPGTERPNRVNVVDILGNGTISLVWSSELPANGLAPIQYVDLMGGKKPYILCGYKNNLGKEVLFDYKSSSHYALRDKREGHPWITKLPFPTMCVSRTETRDTVRGALFVCEYRYRHGYYDHAEREFRGFGMVETVDSESFDRFVDSGGINAVDAAVHQTPVQTRTWYHTGAFIEEAEILKQFEADYFQNSSFSEPVLSDAIIDSDQSLSPIELQQAARACKGMMLRQEVYTGDVPIPSNVCPYSAISRNSLIRLLQPQQNNRYAVFQPCESESLAFHYEGNAADPRISHTLNLRFDDIGNVLESASVVYSRGMTDGTLPVTVQNQQQRSWITYSVNVYTNDVNDSTTSLDYRLRQHCENQAYELTGLGSHIYSIDELSGNFLIAALLAYEDSPHVGVIEKRLLRHQRILFADDADINNPLPLYSLKALGLHYQDYKLTFTPALLDSIYGGKVSPSMLAEGKYINGDDCISSGLFPTGDKKGLWWTASGIAQYPANPDQSFYQPDKFVDPFGSTTTTHYYSNYYLLIDSVEDALGNRTSVLAFDFRFLQPQAMQDINDNITEVSFDILGLVVGTALRGKGNQADDLTGFTADLTPAQVNAFLLDPVGQGVGLLQHATSRFVYNYQSTPVVAASITREVHYQAALASGTPSPLQFAFEYSDGLGRVAMRKVQAEPGEASQTVLNPDGSYTITLVDTKPNRRWVGTGRTVVNNKGNPVMQFEPYFSTTPAFEDLDELVATGVTPILYYDPLDRLIRTDFPDGSFSKVEFDAWSQTTFDQNDTVKSSSWYANRIGGALGTDEQSAAQKASVHNGTPKVVHLDSLGRPFYSVEHNRYVDRNTNILMDEFYNTEDSLDIDGNRLSVTDPRGNRVMGYAYDMLARPDYTKSMDSGERWTLPDCANKPLYGWDTKKNQFHTVYDALQRPIQHEVLLPDGTNLVYEKLEYGSDRAKNQNEKLITNYDRSGKVTHDLYDFKGNLNSGSRTFTNAYDQDIDWSTPALIPMQGQTYTTLSDFDALNRVTSTTTPDTSVTSPQYSLANLLTAVSVSIRGAAAQFFIKRVDHDAKGQRQRIEYGNGLVTNFTYDPQTFRVRRILTTRTSDNTVWQDLNYTYDPIGNITLIHDNAWQALYFNNSIIQPMNDYTYDAVYRLITAKGREHIGQNAPVSQFDFERSNQPHPQEVNAMRNYTQRYDYDSAGNMAHMAHASGWGPFINQWTRQFNSSSSNNRLNSSSVNGIPQNYAYDPQGNMTSLSASSPLTWDFENRLEKVDLGGGGMAYYRYDSTGNRTRKVVQRRGGIIEERLYLGGCEVFTRTLIGATTLRRESLHVMDGSSRLAMVDTRTDIPGSQLIRYQFSNHLGTAILELDDVAGFISYEEYYPFGSTSLQSVDSTREVPKKRYRYTGKERDEESGLYYHGSRYYAPWLARWLSCDPEGLKDGFNLYQYTHSNPIKFSDPKGTESEGFTLGVTTSISSNNNFKTETLQLYAKIPEFKVGPFQIDSHSFSFNGTIITKLNNVEGEQASKIDYKAPQSASPTEKPYSNWQLTKDTAKAFYRNELIGGGLFQSHQERQMHVADIMRKPGDSYEESQTRARTYLKGWANAGSFVSGMIAAPIVKAIGQLRLGPNTPPQRFEGPWTRRDIERAGQGKGPLDFAPFRNKNGVERPLELHHADQMPGAAIHEVKPGLEGHLTPGMHPNRYNQGVTKEMRKNDAALHWWMRVREMGYDLLKK